MDNPTEYLKQYLAKRHPKLKTGRIIHDHREGYVFCWGNVSLMSGDWSFRIMIPRSAPEDGRPLCTTVKHNGEIVWEYYGDHRSFQGVRHKFRVHLHEIRAKNYVQYMLVEVLEGAQDKITRMLRIDGDEFSLEFEAYAKLTVGRLWGMAVHMRAEDRRALDRLLQPQNRS